MEYQDNAAGVTTITGLDDYLITGTLDQYGPMNGVLVNGTRYAYYAKYADITNGTDYETGQGTWSGGNTLSRDAITTSSNAGNSVNWGAGQKAIFIVADAELSTDMEQMVEGATKKILTVAERTNIAASKTKTDLITVTQAVDLDTMEAQINAAAAGMRYRGNWDASSGVFPGAGTALLGDFYYCSVSGTVDGNEFTAGDNIVALVNNASISTYAGNWSKHDQTDAVQSVAGLVGTITSAALRAAIYARDPFAYKPAGEPLVVLAFGDSNMVGIPLAGDPSLQTTNNNLYTWATNTAYNTADLQWRIVNPNATVLTGTPAAPTPLIGILRASNGDTGFAVADQLQRETGRDVYLYHIACGGKTMAYWLPGGGAGKEGMNTLENVTYGFAAAIAAIPGLTQTYADVVIMSDGTNDAGTGVKSLEFITNFQTMYNHMVSLGFVDEKNTQWFQCEPAQVYPGYAAGWAGFNALMSATAGNVQTASSIGLGADPDNVHFTALSLDTFGRNAAASALANPINKGPLRNFFRTESTIADGATAVAHRFDTSTTYANASAKLLDVSNNGNSRFSVLVGNIIQGDPTADTALKLRVAGSASYDLVYTPSAFFSTTNLKTGGANGAWFTSRMEAGAGFYAFRLQADNTLSGSSSLLAIGDAADGSFVTVSRTGLINAKGGFSTTAASAIARTTLTVPTAIVTSMDSPSLLLNGQITHNFANIIPGYRVNVAETHIMQQGPSFTTGAIFAAQSTIKNHTGYTGAFVAPAAFFAQNTYIADTTASSTVMHYDFASSPIFDVANGGTLTVANLWQHYAGATVNTGATVTARHGFAAFDKTGSGSITSQVGFTSNLTSSGATNTTHLLMGTTTPPSGNFGIYQSDTFVNRLNGGLRFAIREATADNVTVTTADTIIKFNRATAQAVALPACSTCPGLLLICKQVGAGIPTLAPNGSDTIDGAASLAMTGADSVLMLFSDGANWRVLHSGAP